MILIPAIDILGGLCVRLMQGDYDQVTRYGDDPLAMARTWQSAGAKRLHLVDLDGAKGGKAINQSLLLETAASLQVPIEVGGGIRTLEQIERYLRGGIDRVILGTAAFRNPELLEQAGEKFPGRVWVGIDAKNGQVAVEGWIEKTDKGALELARECEKKGAGGIIYTDISRDGMLTGPNLDALRKMAEAVDLPLIASGGVSSLEDLAAIRNLAIPQIEGIITGKAIYAGAFTVEEGIAVVEG